MKVNELFLAYRDFVKRNNNFPTEFIINPKDYSELRSDRYLQAFAYSFADEEIKFMGCKVKQDIDCKSFKFK